MPDVTGRRTLLLRRFVSPCSIVPPAAMRIDPNTHAFVVATAFLTSAAFAIAVMNVLAFVLARFVL